MPVPSLDDRALEALLRGSPSAQSGHDWLLPVVEELDRASRQPAPVVRPALALLLRDGFSPEATAPSPPAQAARGRRRAIVRVAGLSVLAKVGLGTSVALAGTTAAGAAGALPGPAQHVVATVVGAATPFNFPDQAGHGKAVSADATGTSDGRRGVEGPAVSAGTPGRDGTPPGPVTTATTAVPGGGAPAGATGPDRANQTPAAGRVPTSLPAGAGAGPPAAPGANAGNGLGTAATTPAAAKVPDTVPVPAAAATSIPAQAGPGPTGPTGTPGPPAGANPATTRPGRP